MSTYRLPRTLRGWRTLFWLTLRRCPLDHSPTNTDPWSYGSKTRYCFNCEGVSMWPGGFWDALRQNARHEEQAQAALERLREGKEKQA